MRRRRGSSLIDDFFESFFADLTETRHRRLGPRVLGQKEEVDKRGRALWRPHMDLYRTPDGVAIALDLPGMSREGVDVELDGWKLTIRGKRPGPNEVDVIEQWESPQGKFEVSVELPNNVDRDNPEAKMKDGRLVVLFPYLGGPIIEGTYRVVVDE